MAQTPRPWHPQGHILFTRGDVSYELLRELETFASPESLLGGSLDARGVFPECLSLPAESITTESGRT